MRLAVGTVVVFADIGVHHVVVEPADCDVGIFLHRSSRWLTRSRSGPWGLFIEFVAHTENVAQNSSVHSPRVAQLIGRAAFVCAGAFSLFVAGCFADFGDESSIAHGQVASGSIRNGVLLEPTGEGYQVAPRWTERGNQMGTAELVGLLQRAARRVAREKPGVIVGIGDLAPMNGGPSTFHRSHENGLDADVLFITKRPGKSHGAFVSPPNIMLRFDNSFRSRPSNDPDAIAAGEQEIDIPAQWLMVKALITDVAVDVQWLFVYEPLRQRLLLHAAQIGEPLWLIELAAATLRQPVGAAPHDDHLHVRIFCPTSDRFLGCKDRAPEKWRRKLAKRATVLEALPQQSFLAILQRRCAHLLFW